jgi:Tfp pilus assembly protein PilX
MSILRRPPKRHQRGAATLVVVMVLFFVVSLTAAYTSRNLIFEQRTSNNQLRSTQAIEAAEAGLEWALSMLNHSRIDANCNASTNVADTSFRERYLTVDAEGRILPTLDGAGVPLSAACVATATGWSCSCPTTATPTVTPPTTTQSWPGFRVRFQRVLLGDATNPALPRQPGVVRIQVVGCTRVDSTDPCLEFDGTGAFNEGRAVVRANLALAGGPSSPPQVALLARGAVNASGLSAYNTLPTASGFTIQSGQAINVGSGTLQGKPGSPGGADTLLPNDAALAFAPATAPSVFSAEDRMFAAVFNARPETIRDQQSTVVISCPGGSCTAAQVRAVAALNPWRPIWVDGSLDLDTAGDIGTAVRPVMLVVNGDLQWTLSGINVYGLVYVRTPSWTALGSGGQVFGATVAEGDITVAGSAATSFIHDPAVVQSVRWNSGSFVRVPASWKDYQQ